MKPLQIDLVFESSENPTDRYSGPAFAELVASVKEKGVLMPILVRPVKGKYEVVAGNRRLRAAKEAGLTEIPARIAEMSDTEAREARIVENLQRADIHPLDEAKAFKDLLESGKLKRNFAELAAKVGKSERYVKDRISLTNLDSKIIASVRQGKLPIGHAIAISRLEKKDQLPIFKKAQDYYGDFCELADLREEIAKLIFRETMKNPPWKDDTSAKAEIAKAVGASGTEKNLFGENVIETFDDPKEYATAVAAWITLKKEEYRKSGKPLTLVSGEYSTNTKGLLGRGQYETGPGSYASKMVKCKSLHDALVVEGSNLGQLIKICTDKGCAAHHYHSTPTTPEDKAAARADRKKMIEASRKKAEKDSAGMAMAVAKVKWPLSEKHLGVFLSLAIKHSSHDVRMQIVKRRALDLSKKKSTYGANFYDYENAIVKSASAMSPEEKAGLLFELLVPGYSPNYNEGRASTFKKL